MNPVKIGVLGAGRGLSMMWYCQREHNARLVAVCDYNEEFMRKKQQEMDDTESVTFYTDFDAFLQHDMDAVVLANFANEHAPFAIRCLKAGKHVISECLPCQNMKEAVELIETVEETGLHYIYSENGSEAFLEKLHCDLDSFDGADDGKKLFYEPTDEYTERAKKYGHGAGDFYCMYHAAEKILGNPEADTIDVYEAMDMFLPGLFAYRSVLAGGIPMEIPNLRDKAVRDQYRTDTSCTDKERAGEQYIPSYSKGNPDVPPSVYEHIADLWKNSQ